MEQLRDLLQSKQLTANVGIIHRSFCVVTAKQIKRTANVHDVAIHILKERVDCLLIAGGLRELRVQQRDFRGSHALRVLKVLQMLISAE